MTRSKRDASNVAASLAGAENVGSSVALAGPNEAGAAQSRMLVGGRRTSISLTEVRATILLEALQRCPSIERVEDITDHLPYFEAWGEGLQLVVGEMVAQGMIGETPTGALIVSGR